MIICKCECVHNEHGECQKDSIVMGLSGCLSKINKTNSTYDRVVKHFGNKEQKKKARQEMQELINELTESIVYPSGTDSIFIKPEMADVLNMFESLKIIFDIRNEELHDAMNLKMERTLKRIQEGTVVNICKS